jgi:hypothetical protein
MGPNKRALLAQLGGEGVALPPIEPSPKDVIQIPILLGERQVGVARLRVPDLQASYMLDMLKLSAGLLSGVAFSERALQMREAICVRMAEAWLGVLAGGIMSAADENSKRLSGGMRGFTAQHRLCPICGALMKRAKKKCCKAECDLQYRKARSTIQARKRNSVASQRAYRERKLSLLVAPVFDQVIEKCGLPPDLVARGVQTGAQIAALILNERNHAVYARWVARSKDPMACEALKRLNRSKYARDRYRTKGRKLPKPR